MATPLVSVSMVTYNHERYVAEAIRSVLGQTYRDLELVVVNDGSTDSTAARIAEFVDPRLVVIHQDNQGPSSATNRALAACRGKYVALFSGDDICHPDRIRCQVEEYERSGRCVLFSACDFIDDDGRPLAEGHFATTIFDAQSYSRAELLARLFYRGNFLNGVTVFAEREVLGSRPYHPGLLQLQDFDVWVRLAKQHNVNVMPARLLSYRVRGGGGNLSSPTRDRLVRLNNEYHLIYRHFFDGLSAELFRRTFVGELLRPDFADGPEYLCEQAFAYCRSPMPLVRLIGAERFHALLNDEKAAGLLRQRYGFAAPQFFDLLRAVNVTESYDGDYSTLFFDTGGGWNLDEQVCQRICMTDGEFSLTFRLPDGIRPRALRWDPVELRTCRVHIGAIEITGPDGRIRPIDAAGVHSNGSRLADGTISFPTSDPIVWWPMSGGVAEVVIRGRWETDDALKTIMAQSRQVHELTQALTESRRELDAVRASPFWRMTAPLRAARSIARRLKAG
jgi:glycosyltransferase involved in cell wall biosynthesis